MPPTAKISRIPFSATLVLLVLSSLLPYLSPVAGQSETLTARRIWKGETDNICCYTLPKPSADGQRVPGVDWYSGDLAFLDLRENAWVRVTAKGEWEESGDFSMNAIFSPDGLRMAHSWWTWTGPRAGAWDLRIQEVDGGDPRILVRGEGGEVWPLDWAPDGRAVLAGAIPESPLAGVGALRLLLVPLDGGVVKALKEFPAPASKGASSARFSPDGQWIAYTEYTGEPPRADVRILSVDGRVDRGLVTGNGDDQVMDWLPDGSGILFHSQRNLTQAIWRLSVEDGLPVGDPEMLKGEIWDMLPMGFGPGGFYYMVPTQAPQVYTAILDLDAGRLTSPPAPVRGLSAGPGSTPAWSPDGRQLAFLSQRAPVGRPELVIQSLETGETRTQSLPFDTPRSLAWVPDGRTLTVSGGYEGIWGMHRLDLQSGEVTTLVTMESLDPEGARDGAMELDLSPDGRTLFFQRHSEGGRRELVSRDLETGREEVVTVWDGGGIRLEPLPDGAGFVLAKGFDDPTGPHRIEKVGPGGTGTRTLWEGSSGFLNPPQMNVTRDGRHLLLSGFLLGGDFVLRSVELETGQQREVYRNVGDDPSGAMRTLALHPDGSRIAFYRGVGEGEIWVMTGF
jgi:Tol biopolymer transport system component